MNSAIDYIISFDIIIIIISNDGKSSGNNRAILQKIIRDKSLFLRMVKCQKFCAQSCVVNYNTEDLVRPGTVFTIKSYRFSAINYGLRPIR